MLLFLLACRILPTAAREADDPESFVA